jgi:chorismate dehydratase
MMTDFQRNLRIGAVSFLNTVPLIEGLQDRPGIDLQRDLPSRLADLLFDGRIDVGLIPVVEYLRGVGTELAAGVCIASHGAVRTVKVFSRVPLEEATSVAVDRGSRSSVALLRVLLAELHDRHPDLHVVEPRPENLFHQHSTALVIGDRAEQISTDGLHVYDLGQMWHDLTGLPFVFAAWVLGPHLAPVELDERRRALIRELGEARDRGLAQLPELAEREAKLRGADAADILDYWTHSIHYRLGDEELEGLRRFADLAADHDLVPRRREVAVAEG